MKKVAGCLWCFALAALLLGSFCGPAAAQDREMRVVIVKERKGLIERVRDAWAARPRPVMVRASELKGADWKGAAPARTTSATPCPPDTTGEPTKRLRILITDE